jgi:hypothetical protein
MIRKRRKASRPHSRPAHPASVDTAIPAVKVYFSDFFEVSDNSIEDYGAFNISLVADLPLFVDPFLLFNSKKPEYQRLHQSIIQYLTFLRDQSVQGPLDQGLLKAWYRFPEVRQNWFGFTVSGNRGSGLGTAFAEALHENINRIFADFGAEKVTKGSHLEKLCLIREGVGKDNISDFTTRLIQEYLLEYTQKFAKKHIDPRFLRTFAIEKIHFNYETEVWEPCRFDLPKFENDYVLLTPRDMLTKDDTWINKPDLIADFDQIPDAIPNEQLRAQINNYFRKILPKKPSAKEHNEAAFRTVQAFPELIDYYIKYKEQHGERAQSISSQKVASSKALYVEQFKKLIALLASESDFYHVPGNTYEEAHARLRFLKDVVENKGGHKIFWSRGKPIEREEDVHILYRIAWFATPSDVSREVNDGRGPADFKISRGTADKSIIEFKLAKNTQLRRNLQKQAEIYGKASDAQKSIKVIVFFTGAERERVVKILKSLKCLTIPTLY